MNSESNIDCFDEISEMKLNKIKLKSSGVSSLEIKSKIILLECMSLIQLPANTKPLGRKGCDIVAKTRGIEITTLGCHLATGRSKLKGQLDSKGNKALRLYRLPFDLTRRDSL